jgi:thiamine-phosphate pyrophosphorylase
MTRCHRKSDPKRSHRIPAIWLMTDERIATPDLLRAIARLPRGAAIIVRHHSLAGPERRALFEMVRTAAHSRGAKVLVAGPARLARLWGADGHHGRSAAPASSKHWLHSAPVHNQSERIAAERAGADVLLISPLFATQSHPGAPTLGPVRFAALARSAHLPVIALGGVRPRHARLIRQLGAVGLAAIDGLMARRR